MDRTDHHLPPDGDRHLPGDSECRQWVVVVEDHRLQGAIGEDTVGIAVVVAVVAGNAIEAVVVVGMIVGAPLQDHQGEDGDNLY